MPTRRAACNCGQLHLTCEGEPARISTCHCLECQRRTGAVFGNQAWFQRRQVTSIAGNSTQFGRAADSGRSLIFRFCPICGSTVYFEAEAFPGWVAVAVGSFADPDFPAPKHSVWEKRRHRWVQAFGEMPVEHSD
ncbi:MAG TPA: GFA family protein [Xanthobacteraceae bacterium]|nr:GFA family protein [Xanthobacteraceae bacterium]